MTLAAERMTRRWIWAVLSLALLVRVVLVWNGGQGFWPDETRYQDSQEVWTGRKRHRSAGLCCKLSHQRHFIECKRQCIGLHGVAAASVAPAAGGSLSNRNSMATAASSPAVSVRRESQKARARRVGAA